MTRRRAAAGTVAAVSGSHATAAIDGPEAYRPLVPVLAAAAAAAAVVGDPGGTGENALTLLAVLPFLLWLRYPRIPPLAVVAVTTVAVITVTRNGALEAALFMMSIAATVVGGYEPSPIRFTIGGVVLAAAPVVGLAVFDNDTAAAVWVMGVILPLALSRVERRQIEMTAALATARAALADQQLLEERRRIARDVHDSVGHGLAAMLLQITGARHVLRRDVEAADEALVEAEQVGRRSMRELRETLGILRAGLEAPGTTSAGTGGAATASAAGRTPAAPVPSVEDADRDAVWSRFTITGDLSRLDPLTATSLHRVAEEAFANAVRHAPDASTDARLDVRRHDVVMTIESLGPIDRVGRRDASDGRGGDGDGADGPRPRYGIVGMSERMAAVGGSIDVGPTASGWLVRAAVPLHDDRVGT